jgi:hypothetical protein
MACERFGVATASERSLPALMCPSTEAIVPKAACTWPPMRSAIAGPVPLYGTCATLVPAAWLNTSNAMCWGVPLPGVL